MSCVDEWFAFTQGRRQMCYVDFCKRISRSCGLCILVGLLLHLLWWLEELSCMDVSSPSFAVCSFFVILSLVTGMSMLLPFREWFRFAWLSFILQQGEAPKCIEDWIMFFCLDQDVVLLLWFCRFDICTNWSELETWLTIVILVLGGLIGRLGRLFLFCRFRSVCSRFSSITTHLFLWGILWWSFGFRRWWSPLPKSNWGRIKSIILFFFWVGRWEEASKFYLN